MSNDNTSPPTTNTSATATSSRATKHQSLPSSSTTSKNHLESSLSLNNHNKVKKLNRSDKNSKGHFPETQSREIFSAYSSVPPLVNLPERGKSAIAPRHDQEGHNSQRDELQGASDEDDIDTDETDVEDDLFDKLQEMNHNSNEDPGMTSKRLATKMDPSSQQGVPPPSAAAPKHHRAAPGTIALPPNSVFTFPSNDYFSPGAPFLAAGAPLTPHPHHGGVHTPAVAGARLARTPHPTTPYGYGLEPETPTISVRIAGSDVIQDVILSPMVERPPAWLQQHHEASSFPRENSQTRTCDEESLYGAHAFPLRPPPHLIRSRRTSRITSHPPSVHPDHYHSSTTMDRRRSSLHQQQQQQQQDKEHDIKPQTSTSKSSGTSAVSPRFMALRKLSESGMLPPPPPPPPTQSSSSDYNTTPSSDQSQQQRLLDKIDEIVESRLKESISEIVWRATESHREARRFYEDQKREILELGASILTRLDRQLVGATRQDTDEEDELDMLRKQRIELESEINAQQLKSIAQASELEALKEETAELRKQLDTVRQRIASRDVKGPSVSSSAVDAELQTDPVLISNEGADDDTSPDWADVVNGEEIWEQKYHELECKYTALVQERPELDKRISILEKENKRLLASTPPPTVIDQPITATTTLNTTALRRHNGSVDRQRKYRSMMAPPVSTSPTPSNHSRTHRKNNDQQQRQSYFMNEEGHLTFTTEINGRLSQYTVKLPTKDDGHHRSNSNHSGTSRLNPNAPAWKAPA
ncbi:hypothetical protein K492DRAFT_204024 [Lichtheimia hyalospora FSU 10163]|nr:hypothetical protein K492DRAFT_204024 [Lichtheimia hyalospora FSU 10163]